MSQSRQSPDGRAPNKRAGAAAARQAVADIENLALVPDRAAVHYDATAVRSVSPRARCPSVGLPVIERGTPVEIKSCLRRQHHQRGRFVFRAEQHNALLEQAGVYLLAVCEADGRTGRRVRARKLVPATAVDQLLGATWTDPGSDRTDHYQRRAWSNFFAINEVDDDA